MANIGNIGTSVPEAPNDHDDEIPPKLNEHEELHAYVRDHSVSWLVWGAVALLLVVFFYFWWGFYAARPVSTPHTAQPIEYPPPPPLK